MERRAFVFLLLASLARADSTSRIISESQARDLVGSALSSCALKDPVSILRNPDAPWPGFYSFSAYGPANPGGSSTIGHFLIDLKTGDVWDGAVCQEYKSVAITKLQVSIRKNVGLTEAEYRKLRRRSQLCDELQ